MGKPKARINYDQRLYVCEKAPDGKQIRIRFARNEDYSSLVKYSAEMMLEDLLEDPRINDNDRHCIAVQHRINAKKTIVGEKKGRICFMLDVGTYFNLGSQVGGTYVPPDFRGLGIASAGMRAACHLLLQNCKKVTLHVHEANIAAIKLYQKVGFTPSSPYRLIAFPSGENK
jgi:predicted GNAT family acetyltransferase